MCMGWGSDLFLLKLFLWFLWCWGPDCFGCTMTDFPLRLCVQTHLPPVLSLIRVVSPANFTIVLDGWVEVQSWDKHQTIKLLLLCSGGLFFRGCGVFVTVLPTLRSWWTLQAGESGEMISSGRKGMRGKRSLMLQLGILSSSLMEG